MLERLKNQKVDNELRSMKVSLDEAISLAKQYEARAGEEAARSEQVMLEDMKGFYNNLGDHTAEITRAMEDLENFERDMMKKIEDRMIAALPPLDVPTYEAANGDQAEQNEDVEGNDDPDAVPRVLQK